MDEKLYSIRRIEPGWEDLVVQAAYFRPEKSQPAIETRDMGKEGVQEQADIRLRFQVDDKTNKVTILVLDRHNQRVIRTIPPEELARLPQGELIELFI